MKITNGDTITTYPDNLFIAMHGIQHKAGVIEVTEKDIIPFTRLFSNYCAAGLDTAVSKLPKDDGKLLHLIFLAGVPVNEVGVHFIPHQDHIKVMTRLTAILKKLRTSKFYDMFVDPDVPKQPL